MHRAIQGGSEFLGKPGVLVFEKLFNFHPDLQNFDCLQICVYVYMNNFLQNVIYLI